MAGNHTNVAPAHHRGGLIPWLYPAWVTLLAGQLDCRQRRDLILPPRNFTVGGTRRSAEYLTLHQVVPDISDTWTVWSAGAEPTSAVYRVPGADTPPALR